MLFFGEFQLNLGKSPTFYLKNLRRNNRILKPNFFPKMSVTVSVTVSEIWPVNRGYGYARLNRDTPRWRGWYIYSEAIILIPQDFPRGSDGEGGSHSLKKALPP